MQELKSVLNSYSNSKLNNINNSNSYSNDLTNVFSNLVDLIPEDDYRPFYVSHYKKLGYKRFMELANKARAGKQPQRLFTWMLKHNKIVL